MSTSLIDQVYIKKSLIEEFFTNVYFSNHSVAKIIIAKNTVDFCTVS